jgi:cell division septum initiation protein DivIVA
MYHHLSPLLEEKDKWKEQAISLIADRTKLHNDYQEKISKLEKQNEKLEQRVKELEGQPSDIKTAEEAAHNYVDSLNLVGIINPSVVFHAFLAGTQFRAVPDEAVEKALAFMKYAKDSDLFYDWDIVNNKTK